jgi:hypothetical protein
MNHALKEKRPTRVNGSGDIFQICPPRRKHQKALVERRVSAGDCASQDRGGKKARPVNPLGDRGKTPKADHQTERDDMGCLHADDVSQKGAQIHKRLSGALRRKIAAAQRTRPIHDQKEKKERKIAVVDFETDPFVHGEIPQAFACGWCDEKGTQTYWSETEEKVIAWAVDRILKFEGVVYAHNGGKFDFPGYIFRGAKKAMLYQPVMLIGSRIVQMKLGLAEIRDSYAILPSPLSAYDKGEIDYGKFKKGVRTKYRAEILDYLRRDCDSLRQLVLRFIAEHGLKPLTAASAAMAAMKRMAKVKTESLDQSQDEKFRKFYFGGRVQCFRPGIHITKGADIPKGCDGVKFKTVNSNFNVYDIKSAYPHAMLSPHACSDEFDFIANPVSVEPSDFVVLSGVANGSFPRRTKKGLFFPNEGEFYISGWEYLAARDNSVLGKHKILCLERPKIITDYSDYVMHFYRQKEEAEKSGDKAGRLIAKILINSGYGKLAQRVDKWEEHMVVKSSDVIPEESPDKWDLKHETTESYCDEASGFAVWSRPSQKPGSLYNVAAAASITGFVRSRLIPVIKRHRPYYCDTDSVIIAGEMKTGKELGDWDFETAGDLLVIAGKKLYGLRITKDICPDEKTADAKGYDWDGERGWKMATKGCRLTPAELMRVAKGETVEYHNIAPTFSLRAQTRFISRSIRKTV